MVDRRGFLRGALGASGILLLSACAQPAPPAPTVVPVPPVPTPVSAASTAPVIAAAAPTTAPATPGPPDVLTFGGVTSMNFLPMFVGVEKGIFLEHGVDLKIKLFGTGADANRAIQAGETQATSTAASNASIAYEQGVRWVNVVAVENDASTPRSDTPFSIHAHAEAGVGPGEFANLRGKRLGLTTGSSGEDYLKAILTREGIAATDLTLVNLPSSNWKSALAAKQVDAVSAWEPFGTQLGQVPGAVTVVQGGGYTGYSISFAPAQKLAQERPELIERLVRGMAQSAWYTRAHRDESAEIATHWIDGLDTRTAAQSIPNVPFDPRLSRYTLQGWEDTMKRLVDQKLLKQTIPTSTLFDTHFIEKVEKEQPNWFVDLKAVA